MAKREWVSVIFVLLLFAASLIFLGIWLVIDDCKYIGFTCATAVQKDKHTGELYMCNLMMNSNKTRESLTHLVVTSLQSLYSSFGSCSGA